MKEGEPEHEQVKIVVYCENCDLELYETNESNLVTGSVASQIGLEHSAFFEPPHTVIVFDVEVKQ